MGKRIELDNNQWIKPEQIRDERVPLGIQFYCSDCKNLLGGDHFSAAARELFNPDNHQQGCGMRSGINSTPKSYMPVVTIERVYYRTK